MLSMPAYPEAVYYGLSVKVLWEENGSMPSR